MDTWSSQKGKPQCSGSYVTTTLKEPPVFVTPEERQYYENIDNKIKKFIKKLSERSLKLMNDLLAFDIMIKGIYLV